MTFLKTTLFVFAIVIGLFSVTMVQAQSCVKGPNYQFDESGADNRCYNDCECDGSRTCSQFNYCQGTARPESGEDA